MTRSLLLAVTGLLSAALFACVLPPPPPPPASGGPQPLVTTCPDGTSFLSHVQLFASAYDPNTNDRSGKPKYLKPPPAGSTIDPNTSPYAAALQNAFQLAP